MKMGDLGTIAATIEQFIPMPEQLESKKAPDSKRFQMTVLALFGYILVYVVSFFATLKFPGMAGVIDGLADKAALGIGGSTGIYVTGESISSYRRLKSVGQVAAAALTPANQLPQLTMGTGLEVGELKGRRFVDDDGDGLDDVLGTPVEEDWPEEGVPTE